MIDVNLIRQDACAVRERYLKRGKDIDFAPFCNGTKTENS